MKVYLEFATVELLRRFDGIIAVDEQGRDFSNDGWITVGPVIGTPAGNPAHESTQLEVIVRDDAEYAILLNRVRVAKGGISPRFDYANSM